jgi:uroporphyrinogen-III synthase
MTSEGLLSLPSLVQVRGQQVLIVKGVGGRTALRDTLRRRGASVEEFCCYRRGAPDLDPDTFAALLRDRAVRAILASSGEVLDNLDALLRRGADALSVRAGCFLIVPSERVATQARDEGWQSVSVASNASDAAMLAALQNALPSGAGHG